MKIFYAKHVDIIKSFNIPYLIPIQSGTANSKEKFDCIHDDDKPDNISAKNELFAELSVQYFIWKNMDFDEEEPIGLFQEKRMLLDNFMINDQRTIQFINAPGNPTKFIRYTIDKNDAPEYIKAIVLKDNYDFSYYDFITRHSTFYLPLLPVKQYFSINNDIRVLKFAIEAIQKYYPDYEAPLNDMLDYTNLNIMDNVFVAKWKNFKAYSKWLFDILLYVDENMMKVDPEFEVTKNIRKNLYERKIAGSYSIKTYAWLAEHLFIVWLLKNRMIRIEKWLGEFTFK